MKSRLSYLYLLFLASFAFSSCQKNVQEELAPVKDLQVPSGFNWETSRNVNFTVEVSDTRFKDAVHVISVYKGDPSFEGTLLSTGAASVDSPFESKIYLADTVSKVFIVKTAPDNSTTTEEVAVQSASIRVSVGQVSKSLRAGNKLSIMKKLAAVSTQSSPDCNTGCSRTINLTANDTEIEVRDNETVCVNGSDKSFAVTFKAGSGTIKICGTNITLRDIRDHSSSAGVKLIVTEGSRVIFPGLTFNSTKDVLQNYGTITFNGSISPQGTITNYGSMTVKGDYNLNSTMHTENGELTVQNNLNINSSSTLTNFSNVVVNNELHVNGQASLINKCNILVKRNLIVNHRAENHGFIKVENETTVNGSADLNMNNNSMLRTGNLMVNSKISGIGATSLIKVSSKTTINGGGLVTGAIQLCDENGIENNWGRIADNASLGCNLYIPVSECNPEGNGNDPKDADLDGVTDALDAYPHDPKRAFNNYYPCADTERRSTLVFEDNWPRRGDYDMNDLAISYRYKVVTNAKNEVVDVIGNFTLYASGGSFQNGFGVEFPVRRSSVNTPENQPALEEGQTNAVVVLFNNMREQMTGWNTIPTEPISQAKHYSLTLTLNNTGTKLKEFGLGVYNPFIFKQGSRGNEIHLPGMKPTDLANTSLFGTADDHSSAAEGRYYLTATGLPWALNIPMSTFEYPIEETEISDAYLKFGAWVQSGGNSYIDWYINKAQGYRNTSKIYRK